MTRDMVQQAVRDLDLSRLDASLTSVDQKRPASPRLVIPIVPPQPKPWDATDRETPSGPTSQTSDITKIDLAKMDLPNIDMAKLDLPKINFAKMDVEKVDAAKLDRLEQPPVSRTPPAAFPETSPLAEKSGRDGWILRQTLSGAAILKFFGPKRAAHARNLDFFRQEGGVRQALDHRWTNLAIAVLTIVALGLMASWYGWRASRAAGTRNSMAATSAASTADINHRPTQNQSSSLFASGDFALFPAPTGNVSANSGERNIAGGRSVRPVKTLPQSAIRSKLWLASPSPVEAATPDAVSVAKASGNLIPSLATDHVATRVPILDKRAMLDKVMADVSPVALPRPIKTVEPEYPRLAKMRGLQGDVVLQLQVDSNGKVMKVTPVSGNSLLSQAAAEAVRQWQYPPFAKQLSTPAVTEVKISFRTNPEGR